jgi:uncharacterized protein with GYD domain
VPSYLIQVAYTPDAWAAMVRQPQNRLEAVRPVVEKLGGKFEHAWLAFGEYDIVGVVELPENTDAAAFSMAVAAGGAAAGGFIVAGCAGSAGQAGAWPACAGGGTANGAGPRPSASSR